MENLPISVIIITKNAEKTVEECLNSVQRNNPAEVIVVDGNSSDRTVEIARGYTESIYSDNGRGKSHARQLGAEQARQEYIAYVDSDVILGEEALAIMLTEFQDSDYVSISARVPPDIRSRSYWEWARRQHSKMSHGSSQVVRIGMAACLFRRETILKYGFELGYDGYLDDVDLEYRMRKDGHKFGRSSALMEHRGRTDLKSLTKYWFFFGRLSCYYMRKFGPWHAGFWPPLGALYWIVRCLFKGRIRLLPYFIVSGTMQTAGMVKGFLELIGEALTRRQDNAG